MSWNKQTIRYKEYDTGEYLEHVLVFNGHGQVSVYLNLDPGSIRTREDTMDYPHLTTDSHEGIEALRKLLSREVHLND